MNSLNQKKTHKRHMLVGLGTSQGTRLCQWCVPLRRTRGCRSVPAAHALSHPFGGLAMDLCDQWCYWHCVVLMLGTVVVLFLVLMLYKTFYL
jgi:hypothetical protein